jgi:hypothetical protein
VIAGGQGSSVLRDGRHPGVPGEGAEDRGKDGHTSRGLPPAGGGTAEALVAGGVRGVDEGAQRAGGLPGPDGLRVGLGGVLQVPEQVGRA